MIRNLKLRNPIGTMPLSKDKIRKRKLKGLKKQRGERLVSATERELKRITSRDGTPLRLARKEYHQLLRHGANEPKHTHSNRLHQLRPDNRS